jgi:hypothetical protein
VIGEGALGAAITVPASPGESGLFSFHKFKNPPILMYFESRLIYRVFPKRFQ